MTIIVVITDGHSHPISSVACHTGLLGHVCEVQLPGGHELVAKKPVAGKMIFRRGENGVFCRLRLVQDGSLQEINVEVSVAIVIQQRNTRAENLRDEVGAGSTNKMLEPKPRFVSHVLEELSRPAAAKG